MKLEPTLYETIKASCANGDRLAEAGNFEQAIAAYNQAWEAVPEPKNQWNASTWILAAIADAAFLAGYFQSAREALAYAMTCPDGPGNPFLHLRYGQTLFEKAELDAAADELMRAWMGAGSEIFEGQDPKYLAFLGTRATLTA